MPTVLFPAAVRHGIHPDEFAFQVFEIAAYGNHGGVVGGEVQGGQKEILAVAACHVGGGVAQTGVGGNPACQHKVLAGRLPHRFFHLVHQ